MKRPRETSGGDVASDDPSASESERADETPDAGQTNGPTGSRDHLNITLGPTLRSAGLGRARACFLCTFTDGKLSEGSIFADEFGPVERVTRLWRENVDNMDVDLLANDCHTLLVQLVSAYAPPPLGASLGDEDDGAATGTAAAYGLITADDVKHHFTVCMTTREARLTALKSSFRHLAQLESACAQCMYTACKKTGRPKPDQAVAALLLKANSALLKTNQLISASEGKNL